MRSSSRTIIVQLPDETADRIVDALYRARDAISSDLDRAAALADLRG